MMERGRATDKELALFFFSSRLLCVYMCSRTLFSIAIASRRDLSTALRTGIIIYAAAWIIEVSFTDFRTRALRHSRFFFVALRFVDSIPINQADMCV